MTGTVVLLVVLLLLLLVAIIAIIIIIHQSKSNYMRRDSGRLEDSANELKVRPLQ